jgi:hypothetical protein
MAPLAGAPSMSPIPPAILALLDAYRAAVLAKDVDAFAALYAADIEVYDLWADWTHRGRDAWRAVARADSIAPSSLMCFCGSCCWSWRTSQESPAGST